MRNAAKMLFARLIPAQGRDGVMDLKQCGPAPHPLWRISV